MTKLQVTDSIVEIALNGYHLGVKYPITDHRASMIFALRAVFDSIDTRPNIVKWAMEAENASFHNKLAEVEPQEDGWISWGGYLLAALIGFGIGN